MTPQPTLQLDIDAVLRSKAGSKARYIPGFVRNWLKRIVHQDELNTFLRRVGSMKGVPWLREALVELDIKIEVHGLDNLPACTDGQRCTFVSNHPLGGPDGIAIGRILGEHYDGKIKYLVNDLLMNLPGLAPLCVPINKTGKQSRDFPRMVEAAFQSPDHIIMFPAGLCSRRQQGVIRDLPWNKTFITKSIETHRDVVPIYFDGRNSDKFYRLANFGKRLGLKFNIAMLYLSDEMFKHRGDTFHVYIGRPIPWQTFDASRRPSEWATWVQQAVYDIPHTR